MDIYQPACLGNSDRDACTLPCKNEKLDADVDFWASWQRQQANVPSLTDEVETELAKYLAAPCQPRVSDPLTWWSDNMAWFFLLSDAARCY